MKTSSCRVTIIPGILVVLLLGCGKNREEKLYATAREQADRGEYEQAVKSLGEITALNPRLKAAHVSKIAIAYDMEDPNFEHYISQAKAALGDDFSATNSLRAFEQLANDDASSGDQRELAAYKLLKPEDADKNANPDVLSTLLGIEDDLGLFEAEQETATRCIAIRPTNIGCHFSDLMVRVNRNDFDSVARECNANIRPRSWLIIPCSLGELGRGNDGRARTMLESAGDIVVDSSKYRRITARLWLIEVLEYQGKFESAKKLGHNIAPESYGDSDIGETTLAIAEATYFQGNNGGAQKWAATVAKNTEDADILERALVLLARLGTAPEELAKYSGKMKVSSITSRRLNAFNYSRVHLYENAAAELEKVFEDRSFEPQINYDLAISYVSSKQDSRAISMFNKIIADKGIASTRSELYYWIISHYELAQCYLRNGDKKNARKYLTEFLEIWKNADEGLVLVANAKAQLSKLSQ